MEIKNAVISSTKLGVQHTDHGILSFYIHLDYGGGSQGFGGWTLDNVNPVYKDWLKVQEEDRRPRVRIPTTLASSLLMGIDQVFQCDWEQLKGVSCRAYQDGGKVKAIGHYLEDKWLSMRGRIDEGDYEFVVTPFKELEDASP